MHFVLVIVANKQLESCALDTYHGTIKHCPEDFEAYKNCTNDKNSLSQCKDLRRSLEKCAVKSKLGELKFM